MHRPLRMWQQLHQLLGLRIAVRITQIVRRLCMVSVVGHTVVMISRVGKVPCVISVDLRPVCSGVGGRALLKAFGGTRNRCVRVDDHLTVPRHVRCEVSITLFSIILPTTPHIQEIELAVWAPSLQNVQCELHSEVWRLRHLKKEHSHGPKTSKISIFSLYNSRIEPWHYAPIIRCFTGYFQHHSKGESRTDRSALPSASCLLCPRDIRQTP